MIKLLNSSPSSVSILKYKRVTSPKVVKMESIRAPCLFSTTYMPRILYFPAIFGSIMGLSAIQHLGPSTPGSITAHSNGMGLRLDHSLVGHSHNLCTILTLAHLIGRTKCRSQVVWLVGVTVLPLEDLPGLRRWPIQATCALLLAMLAGVILVDRFLGVSLEQGFCLSLKSPPFPVIYFSTVLLHLTLSVNQLYSHPLSLTEQKQKSGWGAWRGGGRRAWEKRRQGKL